MSAKACAFLRDAGAEVDQDRDRVRLSPELVEASIATCPSDWNFHAHNPTRNVPICGSVLAYGTAITPPCVSGPDLPRRPGSLSRFKQSLQLCQALDEVHFFYGCPAEPSLVLNCNTNSPLKIDEAICDGLIAMSTLGQPVVISVFSMAGAMVPINMAGASVEQIAWRVWC